ncbi:hypothetical protein L1887_48220 [Cichorium endivia]|nr:hypothetical protein L1887_48220 [Cichorium endivia]
MKRDEVGWTRARAWHRACTAQTGRDRVDAQVDGQSRAPRGKLCAHANQAFGLHTLGARAAIDRVEEVDDLLHDHREAAQLGKGGYAVDRSGIACRRSCCGSSSISGLCDIVARPVVSYRRPELGLLEMVVELDGDIEVAALDGGLAALIERVDLVDHVGSPYDASAKLELFEGHGARHDELDAVLVHAEVDRHAKGKTGMEPGGTLAAACVVGAGEEEECLYGGDAALDERLGQELLNALEELEAGRGGIVDVGAHLIDAIRELGGAKEDGVEEKFRKVLGLGRGSGHVAHEERAIGDEVGVMLTIPVEVEQVESELWLDTVKVEFARDDVHDLLLTLVSGKGGEAILEECRVDLHMAAAVVGGVEVGG